MAAEDPSVSGVSGRYATALFELARDEKSIDAVKADLDRFGINERRRVAAAGSTNQLDRPALSHRSLIQLMQPCAEGAGRRRRVWQHCDYCDWATNHVAMLTTSALTMHAEILIQPLSH